jgi:PEP-CTERM motif-containing protein
MSLKRAFSGGGVAAFAMAAMLAAAHAGPVNLGFETGNLSGWTLNGTGAAATSYTGDGPTWTPAFGNYLGYVTAGCGAYVYCSLSQTFTLAAGQTISGVAGFQANDYLPYNDYADLNINGVTLFSSDVAAVGNFGNTGWVPWSYTASNSGTYTLTLEVANAIDNELPSTALLDSAVPEASTWAMLVLGFAALGYAATRRANKVLAAVA